MHYTHTHIYNALVIEVYKVLLAKLHWDKPHAALLEMARQHATVLYPFAVRGWQIRHEHETTVPLHWQRYQKATGNKLPEWAKN